ncbi:hypothetical protein D9M69_658130 [compost metagenome]
MRAVALFQLLDQLVFANPGGGVLQQLVQLIRQIGRGVEFVVHHWHFSMIGVGRAALSG